MQQTPKLVVVLSSHTVSTCDPAPVGWVSECDSAPVSARVQLPTNMNVGVCVHSHRQHVRSQGWTLSSACTATGTRAQRSTCSHCSHSPAADPSCPGCCSASSAARKNSRQGAKTVCWGNPKPHTESRCPACTLRTSAVRLLVCQLLAASAPASHPKDPRHLPPCQHHTVTPAPHNQLFHITL